MQGTVHTLYIKHMPSFVCVLLIQLLTEDQTLATGPPELNSHHLQHVFCRLLNKAWLKMPFLQRLCELNYTQTMAENGISVNCP